MNTSKIIQILSVITAFISFTASGQKLPKLEVSNNHRYLVQYDGTKEGKPFFYVGETGWELFTRLTNTEVEKYLQVRKAQGFNVIMVYSDNVTGDQDAKIYGLVYPNQEGFMPFNNGRLFIPEEVIEGYWKHIDWVIQKAEEYGFYIAFLPYWGNRFVQKERAPVIATNDMAYNWGYYLGERYKNKTNIIWTLGGDFEPKDYNKSRNPNEWMYKPVDSVTKDPKTFDQGEYMITIATAEGIADGINGAEKKFDEGKADYSTSLMTYHICSGVSSSKYFHDEDFLDFNGMQSGQYKWGFAGNYQMVQKDYMKQPVKPTIDLEPWYENSVWYENIIAKQDGPRCTAFEVRRNAYRSVLAGAMGFTYGNNNVWMFHRKNENHKEKYQPTSDWEGNEGIYDEAALQIIYFKNLFTSRPFYQCIPSQDLINNALAGEIEETHIQAAINNYKSYAIIYIPTGQVFNVDLTQISGNITCWWYNPVNGTICDQAGKEMKAKKPFQTISQQKKTRNYQFNSPSNRDWILILDDASKKLPVPGLVVPEITRKG
ncbi:MAG: hypothetical protein A2W90_03740 [Bacteroidetes bacterium GWF2_42_66]|nr:MAG: hypothetical protein A2W92_18660 [Bacteroidetes bacterium GWA2_42_15]OFY02559.1 MAG: hypothetical protein A2W89_22110 [Bacteroidetes bacterium GWE2_42_39]OFY41341.1 MAG: hypothetical protein A2W90_03740 [Bacteroidetes bacterium GWF2_42_66]HAZ04929.1 hypothetical protein [Marinilabiliales bacterium]HBL75460.1 hypothetical protein [Prolixibacteraceae bacterium]